MSDKTRNIIGWLLAGIPLLALTAGGIFKIMQQEDIVNNLNEIGIYNNIPVLGVLVLFLVVLYIIPKTSTIGFFLICSYLGGVIVGEVACGENPTLGVVLTALFYIGTMIRRPDISGVDF